MTLDIRAELQPDNQWAAIDWNTYDVDCDESGYFSTSPVGYGKTKQDAIDDLLFQMEERGML